MGSKLYGRSSPGSVGGVAIVAGLVGALASAMLWLREANPDNSLVHYVTQHVLHSTDGWTALITVAAVAGGLGLLVVILGSIGSRRGGGTVLGIVLSLVALSYPFAYAAQQAAKPFSHGGPLGR